MLSDCRGPPHCHNTQGVPRALNSVAAEHETRALQAAAPQLVLIDASGAERGRAPLPSEGGATALAVSHDGATLAAACDLPRQCLVLFDAATVRPGLRLCCHFACP